MNKVNRKALTEANDMLTKAVSVVEEVNANTEYSYADTLDVLNDVESIVQDILDDEEMKYDNLSEGLQSSDMGLAMYDAIEALTNAADEIESFGDYMQTETDGREQSEVFEEMIERMETISVYLEEAIYC